MFWELQRVIAPFGSIAEVYCQQGKLIEALAMHEEVLRVRAAVFGLEHLDTASTQENIGVVLGSQGKHAEALEMISKAHKTREKTLGPEHSLMARGKVCPNLLHRAAYCHASEPMRSWCVCRNSWQLQLWRFDSKDLPETWNTFW